ncbi:MAG: O-antigen ligase family protein, partial [Chloroflexi bacterium]|nr:O-antigen ligase family protein [Chloroflexota bacterium]
MNTSLDTGVHSGCASEAKSFTDFLSNLWALDFAGVILFLTIASVSISTHFVFPDVGGMGISTLHNGFILGAFALYGLVHGFKILFNPVIVGYTFILVTTFTVASYHPNLTTLQPFKSYFSLMLGVLLLHIALTEDFRLVGINLVVLLAPFSLLIGAVFHVAGIHDIYSYEEFTTGVYRLQGAAIPAHLASMALLGMLAAYTLARRFYVWIGFLNFAIIAATVTRLHFFLGIVILCAFVWPILKRSPTKKNYRQLGVLSIAAVFVASITIYTLPNFISRSSFIRSTETTLFFRKSSPGEWAEAVSTQDIPDDCPLRRDGKVRVNCIQRKSLEKATKARSSILSHNFIDPDRLEAEGDRIPNENLPIHTSGRLDAWERYWTDAKVNLVFGRGLGAGTVVNEGINTAFEVPHNEYLRLIVDGGFVGLAIML